MPDKKTVLAETAVIDNIKTKAHIRGTKGQKEKRPKTIDIFIQSKYSVIDMESTSYPSQVPRELQTRRQPKTDVI